MSALRLIAASAVCLAAPAAFAHDALPTAANPAGWSYPFSCCSGTVSPVR